MTKVLDIDSESKDQVLLIQAPCVRSTFLPPARIACLVSCLKTHAYSVTAIDGGMLY